MKPPWRPSQLAIEQRRYLAQTAAQRTGFLHPGRQRLWPVKGKQPPYSMWSPS